ncbi:MAG TPA: GNAT family N-acetyltransferase [Noviherbaspirillum sp.]|nr:GNAT family N-acetyltransferase [Noviherbaspirillum sp.]
MMRRLLDNIVWHTLAGPHAARTVGNHLVRRYASGFPPIVAFRNPAHPDFHSLARLVEHGERVHCDGWGGKAPCGWRIDSESVLIRMTWNSEVIITNEISEAVPLDVSSAPAALALATLARPGPFTTRTLELGEHFGIYDGATLVAMAGSRVCAGGFSEISGVCTHPAFTGRGLARRLVIKVLQQQVARGESPFLRVMKDNTHACRLYRRLGFCDDGESVARTMVRL